MSAELIAAKKQINLRSLLCSVANLISGVLMMMNPVFASPSNAQHVSVISYTVAFVAVPLGLLVTAISLIQLIVALVIRSSPKPKTELNQKAYVAIGLGALFVIFMFSKQINFPPLFFVDFIVMAVYARLSKVPKLTAMLVSAILLAVALLMALNISELYKSAFF